MASGEASIVYVGRKPAAIYLAKVITCLADTHAVKVVARGRFILKAIAVAVRAVKAIGCDCHVAIDEDALPAEGRERGVPRIEITLSRKEPIAR